jgi:hypothetical protein
MSKIRKTNARDRTDMWFSWRREEIQDEQIQTKKVRNNQSVVCIGRAQRERCWHMGPKKFHVLRYTTQPRHGDVYKTSSYISHHKVLKMIYYKERKIIGTQRTACFVFCFSDEFL